MQVVIMAGGAGTRLSEETVSIPKPMVEIGGKPILWHIMKQYSHYGFNDFIICCGYKGYMIKEYFANYHNHNGDITVHTKSGKVTEMKKPVEDWNVTLVDTGLDILTGERLKIVSKYLLTDQFMLTYGDGVSDVNITELVDYHNSHDCYVTCTTVQKANRFGSVKINDDCQITDFEEKPTDDNSWINGGFFVFDKRALDFVDHEMLEQSTLPRMTKHNHVKAFKHTGFWKPMDTLRDKMDLQRMWDENPEWKVWE